MIEAQMQKSVGTVSHMNNYSKMSDGINLVPNKRVV